MEHNEAIVGKVAERRAAIIDLLNASDKPISGNTLSKKFDVSRQIIVQDISAIKESGHDIVPTRMGYVMQKTPYVERVFKVWHTKEQTEEELFAIVDLGGVVADVFVWHKVYGRIEATLNIRSRLDVARFLEGVRSGKSTELMSITGGYHYHTVRAESEELLDRIERMLNGKHYIVPEI
ncbi:MAG: transcription repressor NadR [Clostridia bacterium]|nr:transcription repressor NadR [Clostridia bacterium]